MPRLRVFAGWEFDEDDINRPHFVRIGYNKGVPMGGELGAARGKKPGFMIVALKDPDGANLDRVQVIKGWLDKQGKLQEKIYEAAAGGDKRMRRGGKVRPIKSTVDLDTATYTNTVGAASLSTYWEDPDFDPAERAFYYMRVIEIPTPRWTAYDRVRLGNAVDPRDSQVVQDRAYSSPIWYSP